ncbi:spore germination protein [Bacillus tianshenii]|nr:spore germination protein [Bacillus tianshenii]
MPSFIGGPINVNNVSGVMNFGDTLNISPKSSSKTANGSGGGNIGNFVNTNNGLSSTNSLDPDLIDQPTAANV